MIQSKKKRKEKELDQKKKEPQSDHTFEFRNKKANRNWKSKSTWVFVPKVGHRLLVGIGYLFPATHPKYTQ